jgi:hypothetical protein
MKITDLVLIGLFAAGGSTSAVADVIVGPTLNQYDSGYTVSGLAFVANADVDLTGFTFQNQGNADTIDLTDSSGDVLDSIDTPASAPSATMSVDWALTQGQTYYLLQTAGVNALYAGYGGSLPSDPDISITFVGTYAYSVTQAVGPSGFAANEFWASFNDITTSGVAIPEPGVWSLMLVGFGAAGAALRHRRRAALIPG